MHTTDPVAALKAWLSQRSLGQLGALFYGPDAAFAQAVASSRGPTEILPNLESATTKLRSWEYHEALQHRWKLLCQLARLLAGDSFDVREILDALDQVNPGAAVPCDPLPAEEEQFRELLSSYFTSSEGRRQTIDWRPAHWQLLDFLAEYRKSPGAAARERTPVLLANTTVGRVFILVVERAFGPPRLISPDWWRLGLIPFGENDSFLQAVHTGFRTVMDREPKKRLRLRWWLEKHPRTDLWFDALGDRTEEENRSVEVAAACAALALFESDASAEPRPLLDETVAVSALLNQPEPGKDTAKRPAGLTLGKIGYTRSKVEAARRAGLSGVVFSADQKADLDQLTAPSSEQGPVIQCVSTLADAYDSLLITSKAVAEYKKTICAKWESQWDPQPTPTEYVEASQQQRS